MLYSIRDYSYAKWLLSTVNTLDHRTCDITWASEVTEFFSKLYNYARRCTGAWCARIALAWRWVKRMATQAAQVAEHAVKTTTVTGARYLPDGSLYLPQGVTLKKGLLVAKDNERRLAQKCRSKWSVRQRRSNQTDAMQSSTHFKSKVKRAHSYAANKTNEEILNGNQCVA